MLQAAEWQDACEAGQLSSCAVDRSMDLDSQVMTDMHVQDLPSSAAAPLS